MLFSISYSWLSQYWLKHRLLFSSTSMNRDAALELEAVNFIVDKITLEYARKTVEMWCCFIGKYSALSFDGNKIEINFCSPPQLRLLSLPPSFAQAFLRVNKTINNRLIFVLIFWGAKTLNKSWNRFIGWKSE